MPQLIASLRDAKEILMELMDAIMNRRAAREYAGTPIERATIERLIEAAIAVPSAMNLQPWSFAVLLGRERKDLNAVAEAAESAKLARHASRLIPIICLEG